MSTPAVLTRAGSRLVTLVAVVCLSVVGVSTLPSTATAAVQSVTNLAHLDFLLDQVSPGAVPGHTT